ncbi:MAG: hypothetical protein COT85_05465 [Chlamydiae bacterium CG10_big_fil_rev_8_21_14_0_10_42_34]|nr:MAG: hypothetical protein COT85_05465 [Chlamydiae bacterium CG10_big_fil_rev_8_21_14_0_10_42_34]
MKALVSTASHLLLVNLQTYEIQIIESLRGEYYGISWWKDHDFLVLGHSGVAHDTVHTLLDYATSEKGYLSLGSHRSPNILSAPHQIICAPNGWIVATNTGRNCITIYDPKTTFWKDIRINDQHWDRLGDHDYSGEHFNSVFIKNNYLYVLAHAFNKESYILEYLFPECTINNKYRIKNKNKLHNVWVDGSGNMFACNSHCSELIEVHSNKALWCTGSNTYTRGLSATKDVIVIGSTGNAPRSLRVNIQSDLWVIDRKTHKTLDFIPLGPFGGVHDVRILDIADEAHNNQPFKNIDALEKMATRVKDKGNPQYKTICLEKNKLTLKSIPELQKLDPIFNQFIVDEDGWISPVDTNLALAVLKEEPSEGWQLSADYSFLKSKTLPQQHISLVFGYRGNHDDEMLAVLIEHFKRFTHLSLWKNSKNCWKMSKTLKKYLPSEGKLTLERKDNLIYVFCNQSSLICLPFDQEELKGSIGIRSLGGKFKNLELKNGVFCEA